MTTPSDRLSLTPYFPLPPPAGGRGQGEAGRRARSAAAHLTLPTLRVGPLPLPPKGGEGLI
jgi:hypothetical protein